MGVDTKLVSQLREMTGAGMMDCKKVLEETGGDIDKAAEELRKKGIAKAASKADRSAKEGLVHSYVHANGKIGALVKVHCETDFVAKNDAFQELCHELAMQVVAAEPLYVNPEEVPAEVVEKEREMFRAEMANENKPEDIIGKIVEGKIKKYYSEVCFVKQPYIKDDSKTIEDLVTEKIAVIGENIQIGGFCRFDIAGGGVACGL